MKKYILTLFVLFNIVTSCDNTETELARFIGGEVHQMLYHINSLKK